MEYAESNPKQASGITHNANGSSKQSVVDNRKKLMAISPA